MTGLADLLAKLEPGDDVLVIRAPIKHTTIAFQPTVMQRINHARAVVVFDNGKTLVLKDGTGRLS